MVLSPDHYKDYERQNAFMAYNHIEICKADTEESVVKADLLPQQKNLYGQAHGGFLYTMADCVSGLAARADGSHFVTQSSHINFLRNVTSGTIYAKATAVKRGRRMAIYHVEILSEEGKLLADGVADFIRT